MTESELLILLGGIKRGELERRVMNHDFNDHFLAMRGCKQHPAFHAEGDVLVHTDMVVNEAKELACLIQDGWEDVYVEADLVSIIEVPAASFLFWLRLHRVRICVRDDFLADISFQPLL